MRQIQNGFTIVELLIVVVVIAILAAITIVSYNGITNRATESAVASGISQGGKKLATYALQNNGGYPAQLSDVGITNSSNVSYQYWTTTTQGVATYCMTASGGTWTSHVASGGVVTQGPCPGHTGTVPAPLADCPSGYITVPGNILFGTSAFCAMKYEAKNDGSNNAVSTAAGLPWVSVSQTTAITKGLQACAGCHLMTEGEWLTIAHNVASVPSNWVSGTVGSGRMFIGHTDGDPLNTIVASTNDSDPYVGTNNTTGSTQRRTYTLTNGQVIWDFSGSVYEWTNATLPANSQPGLSGESAAAWKQWNNSSMLWRELPVNAFPSYGTPAASAWVSTTQSLGQVYSNYSDTTEIKGYRRGGYFDNGSNNPGVFTLALTNPPSFVSGTGGFRVAR